MLTHSNVELLSIDYTVKNCSQGKSTCQSDSLKHQWLLGMPNKGCVNRILVEASSQARFLITFGSSGEKINPYLFGLYPINGRKNRGYLATATISRRANRIGHG